MPRADEFPGVTGTAVFSDDGIYRYFLDRTWGRGTGTRTLNVIGLNPSTADAQKDDPTIGRCMRFAKHWGYDRLVMTNLFAFRATKPVGLLTAADAIGPKNDEYLMAEVIGADGVLAAWGANKLAPDRVRGLFRLHLRHVPGLRDKLVSLKMTASSAPGHPLYIAGDVPPLPFWPVEAPEEPSWLAGAVPTLVPVGDPSWS